MSVSAEMPRYKCHKEVHALKINAILENGTLFKLDVPAPFAPIEISAEFVEKHKPVAGGYYVVYDDGYKSFSPADAFEGGYTRTY